MRRGEGEAPHPSRLALLALLALSTCSAPAPALADDLGGSWTAREAALDGVPASGELVLSPLGQAETWQAYASFRTPSGAFTWAGPATRAEQGLMIEPLREDSLITPLLGQSPTGSARFRQFGDVLLGSWRLGARSGQAVFTRDGSAGDVRPRDGPEPSVGDFGSEREAWPQLNANHPEVLTSIAGGRGIVASTLSPAGRADPGVHLDHLFDQPFRVFVSNQNRTSARIWQVVALANPGSDTLQVSLTALTSAATRTAPYTDLAWSSPAEIVQTGPPEALRPSGPGETSASLALRGQVSGPDMLQIGAGQLALLSVRALEPGEERITHAHLLPTAPVAAAVLYLPGPRPGADEVSRALRVGRRVPRSAHDRKPSPLGASSGVLIFGRVAGVVRASHWEGTLSNDPTGSQFLTVPGEERSFLWNAKHQALGLAQAGRLLKRLPDSAYRSWGNYGGSFALSAVLRNPTLEAQEAAIFVDSPGSGRARALRQGFELSVEGPGGVRREFARISQRMGTVGETPLFLVTVPAGSARLMTLRAVYSANNTAPNPLRLRVRQPGH